MASAVRGVLTGVSGQDTSLQSRWSKLAHGGGSTAATSGLLLPTDAAQLGMPLGHTFTSKVSRSVGARVDVSSAAEDASPRSTSLGGGPWVSGTKFVAGAPMDTPVPCGDCSALYSSGHPCTSEPSKAKCLCVAGKDTKT